MPRKLKKAAKRYEAMCAEQIKFMKAAGVEATDDQLRNVLHGRMLALLCEASQRRRTSTVA
jgi:hypothetical protein